MITQNVVFLTFSHPHSDKIRLEFLKSGFFDAGFYCFTLSCKFNAFANLLVPDKVMTSVQCNSVNTGQKSQHEQDQ